MNLAQLCHGKAGPAGSSLDWLKDTGSFMLTELLCFTLEEKKLIFKYGFFKKYYFILMVYKAQGINYQRMYSTLPELLSLDCTADLMFVFISEYLPSFSCIGKKLVYLYYLILNAYLMVHCVLT